MGESRDINVKTSAFELTIHWNPTIVGSQACIFIGLAAIALFAGKGVVRNSCFALMAVDVLTLFIGLLGKSISFDDENTDSSETTQSSGSNEEQSSEPVDVDVHHNKSSKSSVKTSSKTIKNKVKMPNSVTPKQASTAEQQSQESAPVQQSQPQEQQAETSPIAEETLPVNNDPIEIDMDELDPDLFDLF